MNKIFYIYKKEMNSFFVSSIAYIVIALFLLISGYFFSIILLSVQEANVTVRLTVGNMSIILLFMTPGLTMRLLTEEKKTRTIELLTTAPLRIRDIILGKYLACLVLYIIMLALTSVYLIILIAIGKPDLGPIYTNYLGLLLLGGTFISIGLFTSSLTENQMIAFVLSLIMLLLLWLISWLGGVVSFLKPICENISIFTHFDAFEKGIIDLIDVFYYLAFIFIFLFLTIRVCESQQLK